ncbi:MAG: UV DNA damage repair endonuclease UvsE [Phycisphaerae bacterium]|nr:UV DNA damage repair endonuclease UvsE [Gemmatimonadaceae bacterium]
MIEPDLSSLSAQPSSHVRISPRLGLCCAFVAEPTLKFRTTTVAHLARLAQRSVGVAIEFYGQLIRENLDALERVLSWCSVSGVHAFRINSDLWPRATHPLVIPWVHQLFDQPDIATQCRRIRETAHRFDIRLSEHPDQFLVGNSLRSDVVDNTIAELEWRGKLGDALGVDVVCLHIGSGLPDRETALWRWESALARLSPSVLNKLAFENDDRVFAPEHILPACLAWGLPLVYDAHHHRVFPDSLSQAEATEFAVASWGSREPYFHLSSPRAGWDSTDARPHHDMIEPDDWPGEWTAMWEAGAPFTVDVEAKAKEHAVLALRRTFAVDPAIRSGV